MTPAPTLCAVCGESIVQGEDHHYFDAESGGEIHDHCHPEGTTMTDTTPPAVNETTDAPALDTLPTTLIVTGVRRYADGVEAGGWGIRGNVAADDGGEVESEVYDAVLEAITDAHPEVDWSQDEYDRLHDRVAPFTRAYRDDLYETMVAEMAAAWPDWGFGRCPTCDIPVWRNPRYPEILLHMGLYGHATEEEPAGWTPANLADTLADYHRAEADRLLGLCD